MSRLPIAGLSAVVLIAMFGPVPRVFGQTERASTLAVYQALAEEIDTKDFTEAMPFKQFAELIYQKYQAKRKNLPIIIDGGVFNEYGDEQYTGPYDDEVKLPPVPKQMRLADALNLVMAQLRPQGAYLVRNFGILVTTRKQAAVPARLRELVVARFYQTPVADVVQQLADTTGATSAFDPRLKEKAKLPITVEFRGDVSLDGALTAVTDMAEMRVVNLDNCLYVTTPANAEAFEKRMRERTAGKKEGQKTAK